MRGEPGSNVKLTIMREDVDQPIELNLLREVIQVASVRSRIIEDGYGYIRIAQFQSGTGAEVETAVSEMMAANAGLTV
jgi:carboxyl-terminal processing protease